MRAALVALVLAGAAAPAAALTGAQRAQVTPIQKVIAMLTDMMAKGKQEKDDEQVRFSTYTQFCASTSQDKKNAIAKGSSEVDSLKANIAQLEEQIMTMGKEIKDHDDDIDSANAEKAEAAAARETEHADFVVEYKDYTDSIESVERAKEEIEAQTQGGSSLLQQGEIVRRLRDIPIPASAQKAMDTFMLQSQALADDKIAASVDAPEAAHYESQSGGVLGMVEGMGEKFEEKREEVEKEEMNKKHAFDMLAQDLVDSIESAEKQRNKKAARKAEAAEQVGADKGELSQTSAVLADDEKFLSDLTSECTQKSADFEKRQEMRQGEIEAVNKAIELMSSATVSGVASGHALVQTGTSLVQLRSVLVSPIQKNVAAFLKDRAEKTHSRLLSLVALRCKDDPFKKVSKMIKDMIQKLMTEATEEAEHKGFCDTELTTNKQTRDSKTEDVDELTAEQEKLTADVQSLSNEITRLGSEVAELDAEMAKASAMRTDEKEKNQATLADSKSAQAATAQAMAVLKEYYDHAASQTALPMVDSAGAINYDGRALTILSKAGGGASLLLQEGAEVAPKPKASLVQVKAKMPGSPDTFEDTPYTGMGGEGGVLGLLEVIESDFARLIADTSSAEQEGARVFEQFSNDSAEDKAVKTTDMKSKTGTRTRKASALAEAEKDLKTTKEELAAAMDYYEKLKPSCVDAGISYEERVQHRKEEIESLQEALKILSES